MASLGVIVLAGIVLAIVVIVQRVTGKSEATGSGNDILAYLILALAMGTAGFALAELASTAFPGDRFVFDPAAELATSLSALAVSVPFLVYFWNRQQRRRVTYPDSPGWTVYLALMELVFMTAFVISAVLYINGLLGEGAASSWTGALVFGLIVAFHEFAVMRTPPGSDSAELPRVIGSAIGLVTLFIGLAGTLTALFSTVFPELDFDLDPWLAMLIVGAPVWAYRWMRPWLDSRPSVPRVVWLTVVSIASMAFALGATVALLVMTLQYVLTETPTAAVHFETASAAIGLLLAATPTWLVHRRVLGGPESDPVRAYRYAIAGMGLVAAVSTATALTVSALKRDLMVAGTSGDIVTFATVALAGVTIWRSFERAAAEADGDGPAPWPRRLYHLGLGVIFGLVAAGSLITTLFLLLERVLNGSSNGSVLEPIIVLVYTGAAAWYLIAGWARDRRREDTGIAVRPFHVTVVTSHPGPIATLFPPEARLRVIHRGDDVAPIRDDMAAEIVAAVGETDSIVWVDEDGFRVAPGRQP